ncbi:MAG: EAL domain-containing protein, partial [Gammaproteobacteria bacterium]|nr:EAL domain-containing protein [Gammaproteobacteria bacterium]
QHRLLLRNVIDTDPNLIFVKDSKGRYTLVNKAMADLYGTTVKQLIGKTDHDLKQSGEGQEHFEKGDQEVLSAMQQMVMLEESLTSKDGGTKWFQTVKRPLMGATGKTDQVLGIAVDVTQRREAENAMRESESRFKDFAETAADWFWEIGPDFRFTYIAGRYEEVTGLTAEEIVGLSHRELFKARVVNPGRLEQYQQSIEAQQSFAPIEYEWIRPDGTTRMIRSSCKPVFDNDGAFLGYRGTARDVTDAYRLSRQLSYQASHDMLTGLVNRRDFERRLERVLKTARTEGAEHALCYLDLDQFKVINDTCGHVAGDELLRQLGRLLPDRVRKRDTLARLGGDEFGVLMERCSLGHAMRVANDLKQAVQEYGFVWEGKHFNIGVSIGLVPITSTSTSITEVLREADAACYAAKREGRNRVHVYRKGDPALTQHHGEMQWILQLNQALENDGFFLCRQPIMAMDQNIVDGEHYELLLRLRTSTGERMPPGAFLPAAERYDLAPRLDRWVVRTALSWFAEHPDELARLGSCSINLCGQSTADEEFLDYVKRQLDQNEIPPEKVCFEVTEMAAIANLATVTKFMTGLKERGCQFALDDFGSGLSSFAYLRSLPVDYLKIDGTFVQKIAEDQISLAIVRSINDIGKVMGKKTIAEHVENDQIYGTLKAVGVDYVQGYLLGRPQELDSVQQLPPQSANVVRLSS